MVSLLTRRLLREWKNLTRCSAHIYDQANVLYHLKPQDSNLHIWHLVLNDPSTSVELYVKLFIGPEEDPTIIMKCLTPNDLYPTNRNISLTHLNCVLVDCGLMPFLNHVWRHFFEKCTVGRCLTDCDKSKFTHAWNRIICKEFKTQFPELLGSLVPGDYQMVKSYYRESRQMELVTNTVGGRVEDSCTKNSLIACDGDFNTKGPVPKRSLDTSNTDESEPSGKRLRK